MALRKCRDCGEQVSTTAKACPQCGARVPSIISGGCMMVVGIFFFIIFSSAALNKCSDRSDGSDQGASPPSHSAPAVKATQMPSKSVGVHYLREDSVLERKITTIPYKILSMFASNGSGNGVAGLMKRMGLGVVPGGTQAYCEKVGIPNIDGCYVEFYFTKTKFITSHLWDDHTNCGVLARWRAPINDPSKYAPNSRGAIWLTKGNDFTIAELVSDNWRLCHSN